VNLSRVASAMGAALIIAGSAFAAPFELGSTYQMCGRIGDCQFGRSQNVGFFGRTFKYTAQDGITSTMSGFGRGIAYYGYLGASARGRFDDYRPGSYDYGNGSALIAVLSNAMFKDTFLVRSDNPEFTSGFLEMTFRTSGSMRGSGFLLADSGYQWSPEDPVGIGPFASLIINDFAQSANVRPGVHSHTFYVPFRANEPFAVKTNLWAGVAFFDGPGRVPDPYDLYARASFLNTAVVTGMRVLDGQRAPVDGAVIDAASGSTYPASVPEPASVVLLGVTLVASAVRSWCRREGR
jgi:hypothetical protein